MEIQKMLQVYFFQCIHPVPSFYQPSTIKYYTIYVKSKIGDTLASNNFVIRFISIIVNN